MRPASKRRAAARARAAEKSSTLEQLLVLTLGAIALLGFLLTT
jgi:hypothetical protein